MQLYVVVETGKKMQLYGNVPVPLHELYGDLPHPKFLIYIQLMLIDQANPRLFSIYIMILKGTRVYRHQQQQSFH